mgnify:CR=1 FL=1
MNLLERIKGKPADTWLPGEGAYPSLFALGDHGAALKGKSGVFAIWHLGVRPQWLRVGACADLSVCLKAAAEALKASPFRGNGGLYVAWVTMPPARCPGIVTYLRARLRPALQEAVAGEATWAGAPAPTAFALPPGTTEP